MTKKNGSAAGTAELASLQKVRDLLLDSDRRETEGRITTLEKRLSTELERGMNAIRKELKVHTTGMEKRLGALEAAMEDSEVSQAEKLEAAKKALRTRVDKLDADSKQRAKGLRERITAMGQKLKEDVTASEAKLLETIHAGLEQAEDQGVHRHQLAAMLSEVAEQLAAEAK